MGSPALAGAGAMDQLPTLRAAAARASIQRREWSEFFLKLSMFAFELKSFRTLRAIRSKYAGSPPRSNPDPLDDGGREPVADLQCWRGGKVPVPASDR